MSLSEILKKIKEVKPFAEENVDEGPVETLAGRRGRKNQSIESLKRLKTLYKDTLRETAVFILVVGDKRDEFTKVATENYKCFSSDPDFFYSDLIDRIPNFSYLGKENIVNIFDILGRHLEDKALELDIIGYPQLIFRQEYHKHISSRQDLLDLVKQAVTEQVGGEVVGVQAVKNLTDVAIERNNAAQFTPILLPSGDEKFVLTVAKDLHRINNKVFIVVAGETSKDFKAHSAMVVADPTNENIKKTLKTISNHLKKMFVNKEN